MENRKPIPRAARYAVWDAWDGKCAWCWESVFFANCHIDHLIPLAAVRSIGADALRLQYNLPDDFDFDDFPNWIPACPKCNHNKAARTFSPSPEYLLQLVQAQSRARMAVAIYERINRDAKKEAVLARLDSAIEQGTLTKAEIESFLADLPRMIKKGAELPDQRLLISSSWEFTRSGDGRTITLVGVISSSESG
jgi:hypothetical protein